MRGLATTKTFILITALAAIGLQAIPAQATAVAENFMGTSLNNPGAWVSTYAGSAAPCLTAASSTATAQNLAVGSIKGCSNPAEDSDGAGRLRINKATSGSEASSFLYYRKLDPAGGLDFSFHIAEWGKTKMQAGDGLAFYLKDASVTDYAPGGFGGGLGYGNMDGAILGVGFDAYGNFTGGGGSGGCTDAVSPSRRPNQIVVRSGDNSLAKNGSTGFCILGTTGSGSVDYAAAGKNGIEVRVVIDPNTDATPKVTVYNLTADAVNPVLTVNAPAEYKNSSWVKFGFSASTAGANNNHDVWGVGVQPVTDGYSMLPTNPNIVSQSATSAVLDAGQELTPVTFINDGADCVWSIDPALPEGLTIDSATGRISGTPTVGQPETEHTIYCTAGEENAATATFTLTVISPIPDTPAAPTVVSTSSHSAVVSLTPNASGEAPTYYTIYAAEDPTKYCTVNASAVPLQCSVNGLAMDEEYHFVAVASNDSGDSDPSNPSKAAKTSGGANDPGNVWLPNNPSTPGTDDVTAGDGEVTIKITPDGVTDPSQIVKYVISSTTDPTKSCTITLPTTSFECTVTGLTNDKAYSFIVTGFTASGGTGVSEVFGPFTPKASTNGGGDNGGGTDNGGGDNGGGNPKPYAKLHKIKIVLFFDPNSDIMSRWNWIKLKRAVKVAGSDAKFIVTGYVQATGKSANDYSLSKARTERTIRFLAKLGVTTLFKKKIGERYSVAGPTGRRVEVVLGYRK